MENWKSDINAAVGAIRKDKTEINFRFEDWKEATADPVVRNFQDVRADREGQSQLQAMSVSQYKSVAARHQKSAFKRVVSGMQAYFTDAIVRGLSRLKVMDDVVVVPGLEEAVANQIAQDMWDMDEERDILIDAATSILLPIWVIGARTEEDVLQAALDARKGVKQTSAEAMVERLGIDVPEGISLGPYPEWMIAAATETLSATMEEDYWQKIPATTRDDVANTLNEGIETGQSIRTMTNNILDKNGDEYTLNRARMVARTECLPGDIVVDGANITAAHKRPYSGEFVEVITDTGIKFTATPNHPMLTARGWVPIGEITESDYLVGCSFDVDGSGSTADVDVNHRPSQICEVYDSLTAVSVGERTATAQPDFHGDGGHGDVHILRPYRHLRHGRFSSVLEFLDELGLEFSDVRGTLLSAHCDVAGESIGVSVGDVGPGGRITFNKVKLLRRTDGTVCHVFNLSCEEGYYLANGLYTGNSAAMLNAGHAQSITNMEDELGVPMGKEWLSVKGNTTRPTHAEASGQVVPAKGLFNLGGHMTPYPAHASLPAHERIYCQCSVLSSFNLDSLTDDLNTQEEVVEEVPLPLPIPVQAPVALSNVVNGIPHLNDLERTDQQIGGSTGAEVWVDADGNKYVVKTGSSPEHLTEEFVAEEMYRAMGIAIPDSRLLMDVGAPTKISKFIEGGQTIGDLSGKAFEDAKKQAQRGFAADAVMGNWDAAGLGLDNMLVDKNGKVWRIDAGGALRFRAQGQPKGGMFTDEVGELWSLRDRRVNGDSAELFGDISFGTLKTGLVKVSKKADKAMKVLTEIEKEHGVKLGDLRSKMKKRFKSSDEIRDTFEQLDKDGFKGSYVDRFAKHESGMRQDDLFSVMPKELKKTTGRFDLGKLEDENGKEFDGLRDPSTLNKVKEHFENKDMDHGIVKRYASDQAGSSHSPRSVQLKEYIALNLKVDPSVHYWAGKKGKTGELSRRFSQSFRTPADQEKYEETMAAHHAWTYNMMKRIDQPNSDRKRRVISLGRTENNNVLDRYGLTDDGDYGMVQRGVAESFSLTHSVVVGGSTNTYQEVPFSRVIGHYAHSRDSRGGGLFLDDSENELIVIPHGIEAQRGREADDGDDIASPEQWKKWRKRKIEGGTPVANSEPVFQDSKPMNDLNAIDLDLGDEDFGNLL